MQKRMNRYDFLEKIARFLDLRGWLDFCLDLECIGVHAAQSPISIDYHARGGCVVCETLVESNYAS